MKSSSIERSGNNAPSSARDAKPGQSVPALALLILMVLQGCAVVPLNSTGEKIASREACGELKPALNDLCAAIDLADGYRRGYLKRAGAITGIRENLGYAVIAASALALYYGATPQPTRTNVAGATILSPDYAQRVRRLGAFGAGLYAYGQWGSPKARDLVYIDGARAMSCAVLKAAPVIPAIKLQTTVIGQRGKVVDHFNALRHDLSGGSFINADAARALLDDAQNLVDEADRYVADAASAGLQLRARIELIDIAVRRRLVDDSPTFESLVALSASLPGVARSIGASLAPPAKAAASGATASKSVDRSTLDLGPLQQAMAALRASLESLARVQAAVDEVQECAVGDGAKFGIAPAATNASIAVGASYQVIVTDPVGHPSASIAGGQTSALELKATELTGKDYQYRISVLAKSATTDGSKPILSIRSASGISGADISLSVTAKAETVAKGPLKRTDECNGEELCAFDSGYIQAPEHVLAVQCLVGAKPDCVMGEKTRAQITKYREDKAYAAGNFIDAQIKRDAVMLIDAISASPAQYVCAAATVITCPVLTP